MSEKEVVLNGAGWRENTPLLQEHLDALSASGGGVLVVRTPREGSEIGAIQIPSWTVLHISAGSTLRAALERDAYHTARRDCLIESHDAVHVGITGSGVIDGRGVDFMEEDLHYIYKPLEWRPRLVAFFGCEDVRITNVTLYDAASWTLHPIGCRRVLIDGITINNSLRVPNCDGIDPDRCQDVRIANCTIHCADDCIVLKTTKEFPQYESSRRITVSNCTLVSTSAAIKIGTESVADFSDITITGCTITDSSRGIALQLRDQGNIERVIISDCTITTRLFDAHYWGRAEAVSITALPRFAVEGEDIPDWNPDNQVGTIRDVTIRGLRTHGENGIVVYGVERRDSSRSVERVRIESVDMVLDRLTRWPAGHRDLRPCDALGPGFRDPDQDPGLQPLPHSAISIEGTSGVTVTSCSVTWRVNDAEGFGTPIYVRNNCALSLREVAIDG